MSIVVVIVEVELVVVVEVMRVVMVGEKSRIGVGPIARWRRDDTVSQIEGMDSGMWGEEEGV